MPPRVNNLTADHENPKEKSRMKKTAAKKTAATRADYGEILNFRVWADFRRRFKTYAAAHDLKMSELLRQLFEAQEAKYFAGRVREPEKKVA
jgi:hypothetical protein